MNSQRKPELSSETFVCRIYNLHRTDSIDAARHLLFSKTGNPEYGPTSDALRFHLTRVHYQAMIWRYVNCPTQSSLAPRNGMDTWGIRTATRTDGIESHTRQLPRYGRLFVSETMQDSSLQSPETKIVKPATD